MDLFFDDLGLQFGKPGELPRSCPLVVCGLLGATPNGPCFLLPKYMMMFHDVSGSAVKIKSISDCFGFSGVEHGAFVHLVMHFCHAFLLYIFCQT